MVSGGIFSRLRPINCRRNPKLAAQGGPEKRPYPTPKMRNKIDKPQKPSKIKLDFILLGFSVEAEAIL